MNSINTDNAPAAIGTYSQAVVHTPWVFLSGQIGLSPESMSMVQGGIRQELHQIFKNLSAVCQASGGTLANIIKLTIYLTDLSDFTDVNEVMTTYFSAPYPARAAVEVSALPKGAMIEIEGVMIIEN